MGFFEDNDPFESIVREFFGHSPSTRASAGRKHSETIIQGEEEDRIIDFVEDENSIYLVFELPGYNEKDVSVTIKGKDLEIRVAKNNESCYAEKAQEYLIQKLCQGIFIKKTLPKFIQPKGFKHTMKNGILEIIFSKK